ncbi:uncharacterized protein LOC124170278 isoform X1 [Ischnura elegans]|uniref:uncharacterized protein LOC124170278 isoform X1 n=1 Tax=Ischnura elegans TaxID=197161 RepID=UPI001ED86D73|nr:uncharacterized protein LOC124170278 isoform X1 [Ischnura elegans]
MGYVGSPKYTNEDIEHEVSTMSYPLHTFIDLDNDCYSNHLVIISLFQIRIARQLSWSSEFDSSDEIEHELNIVNDMSWESDYSDFEESPSGERDSFHCSTPVAADRDFPDGFWSPAHLTPDVGELNSTANTIIVDEPAGGWECQQIEVSEPRLGNYSDLLLSCDVAPTTSQTQCTCVACTECIEAIMAEVADRYPQISADNQAHAFTVESVSINRSCACTLCDRCSAEIFTDIIAMWN